jgi:hypothetical protein
MSKKVLDSIIPNNIVALFHSVRTKYPYTRRYNLKLQNLAKLICAYEGKKEQVNIAQVMEILKILYTIDAEYMGRGNFIHAPLSVLNEESVKIQNQKFSKKSVFKDLAKDLFSKSKKKTKK